MSDVFGDVVQGGGVPTDAQKATVEVHPFEFTGTAGELFRIWSVNLALSIVTLGIYSAWAKVRTQRYLYGSTRLAGSSFDYLADPIAILKGRLIAFALFGGYSLFAQFEPVLSMLLAFAVAIFTPWMIVRSLAFRARHSSYRNIRFGFDGTYNEAAVVYLLNPIALIFTLGLAYPWVRHRQSQFVVGRARFGTLPFQFGASTRGFFRIYFDGALWASSAFLLVGLGFLVREAMPIALPAAAIVLVHAYYDVTASVANLTYNETTLARHSFESRLRASSMTAIQLTNTLAIVLSLGLLVPWAKVRMARYRASCLTFYAVGGLDDFVAHQEQDVSALGEEMGEMFDIDIGF